MQMMSKFVEFDREELDQRRQITKQALLERRQSVTLDGKKFMMWPLFFRSNSSVPESEVDVCTSALGIVAGSKFELGKDSPAYQAISDAVSLLLYMRNKDGSWPTHISLVGRKKLVMEGVINDTYYALRALMSIDFLSQTPKVKIRAGKKLKEKDARCAFIEESVNWLLHNRVSSGWRYTGIAYLENPEDRFQLPACTTPSAHTIIILSQVMDQLRNYSPHSAVIAEIQSAIDETVRWFHDTCNSDGGFGAKASDASKVSNTAKVILALSSVHYSPDVKDRAEKTLKRAVKWLTSHYDPDSIKTENVCEEFSQIIITPDGPLTRNMIHEDFIEPLLIEAMIRYKQYCHTNDVRQYKKRKVNAVISQALEDLLALQVESGDMRGLVGSHRPIEEQRYTMYSCCDFFCAISLLIESRLDRAFVTNRRAARKCTRGLIVVFAVFFVIVLAAGYPKYFLAFAGGILVLAREILVSLATSRIEKKIFDQS